MDPLDALGPQIRDPLYLQIRWIRRNPLDAQICWIRKHLGVFFFFGTIDSGEPIAGTKNPENPTRSQLGR